ncbi:MAG: Ig-like domain-containing protein, partial [Kiloniellaceae bacterium]
VALSIEWPDPGPGVHQVFALAQGTNTPFTAIMVCVPAPPEEAILLQPPGATLPVGETHTVTASVLDLLGNPIPGLDLSFSVTGANSALGTATTGADGTAVFSYTGGNAGQDSVIASVFDEISNAVSALWEQAATALTCDVDGDADVDIADINLIFAARGSAAGPGDARDLDGDGLITINDARGCVLQCTKARCAP